ncbi:MAG: alginate export family protein [Burkholderiaceae bacterium]|nr:alginate export family protein [Burkholderiaceae bacterium]
MIAPLVIALALLAFAALANADKTTAETDTTAPATTASADSELRQRLTQREDQRRTSDPWHTDIFGRTLTVSGEVALDHERMSPRLSEPIDDGRSRLSTLSLEAEAFYSVTDRWSLFVQGRLGADKALREGDERLGWTRYVERGEMWLHGRSVGGSGLDFELGRLNFEDERRWWLDEELDALRVSGGSDKFEFSLAAARELGRSRSDQDGIDPEQQDVIRWIANAGWEWRPNHSVNLFMLRHRDRSTTESVGQVVRAAVHDDSDARLTWVGASLEGEANLRPKESLHHWLDVARVCGDEAMVEFGTHSPDEVTNVLRRKIRGWAADAGLRWQLPLPGQPRLSLAYAITSSGTTSDTDRAYRQTGLHSNLHEFGAAKEFARYGSTLALELSNLRVTTLGVGLTILKASSVDLVYHRYRQAEPATEMRAARFASELTGLATDIGSGLDLVLTFLESERVELNATVSTFRAGEAFGALAGRRYRYGAVSIRVGF